MAKKKTAEVAKKFFLVLLGLVLIALGVLSYVFGIHTPWWPHLLVLIKGGIGLVVIFIGLMIIMMGIYD